MSSLNEEGVKLVFSFPEMNLKDVVKQAAT